MKRRFIVGNISVLLMLVVSSACAGANATATTVPARTIESNSTVSPIPTEITTSTEPPLTTDLPLATPTLEANTGEAASGSTQCANDYYPIREGATWTYSSTGGPMGGYGFTDTIDTVREDGFTLSSRFGDLIRTQEWACGPEGLVALQLGGTMAAVLNQDNLLATLDVDHVSGVTFPSAIDPGDTWQHTLEFTGQINVAGQDVDAKGEAQSSFGAVGYESVTVPAGTFDALKIHIDTTVNIGGNFNGVSFPVKVTMPYDYWFVKDVGWVKASGTGNVSGEAFNETIELQTYTLP